MCAINYETIGKLRSRPLLYILNKNILDGAGIVPQIVWSFLSTTEDLNALLPNIEVSVFYDTIHLRVRNFHLNVVDLDIENHNVDLNANCGIVDYLFSYCSTGNALNKFIRHWFRTTAMIAFTDLYVFRVCVDNMLYHQSFSEGKSILKSKKSAYNSAPYFELIMTLNPNLFEETVVHFELMRQSFNLFAEQGYLNNLDIVYTTIHENFYALQFALNNPELDKP